MGVGQACRAVAIWVLILVLAMGNGLLRQTLLVPRLGAVAGLLASGLLLCALIWAMTWLLLPWLGVRGAGPQPHPHARDHLEGVLGGGARVVDHRALAERQEHGHGQQPQVGVVGPHRERARDTYA